MADNDRHALNIGGAQMVFVTDTTTGEVRAFVGPNRLASALKHTDEANGRNSTPAQLGAELIYQTTGPLDEALTSLVDAWVAHSDANPDVPPGLVESTFYAKMLEPSDPRITRVYLMQAIVRLADLRAGVPGVTP